MARPFDRGGPSTQDSYRVDRRIRVPEVRVIGADNQQLGIMPTDQALRIAEEAGLNLVEVSPKAMPPVCKIMDYGKFKYQQSKQQAQAKKHASTIILKEVKFRPKTDDHDFDFKVRHIRRFLGEGNKAKLVIVFRGREIVHPETGQAMLKQVFEAVQDIAVIEQNPMMEGRRMLMILAPKAQAGRPAAPRPVVSAGPSPGSSASAPTGQPGEAPGGPPPGASPSSAASGEAPSSPRPEEAAPPVPSRPVAPPSPPRPSGPEVVTRSASVPMPPRTSDRSGGPVGAGAGSAPRSASGVSRSAPPKK